MEREATANSLYPCIASPQGTVKYVSPQAVMDLHLSSLEGYMRYLPVLYSKIAAFRQEWKVRYVL